MKEFEKWAESRGWIDKRGNYPPGVKEAWKAVLEFALKQGLYNADHIYYSNIAEETLRVIEDELNENE